MVKYRRSERGQVLFLIAFALVALLGISAMAMDGGRIYSDRRKAQNTADTSAFAGALVIAKASTGNPTSLPGGTFTEAIKRAQLRAVSNGYDTDDDDVSVSVSVTGPFTDEGVYYLVEVTITSQLETTFAHLVYDGPLVSTVYAIAKARPPQNLAFGYAIYGNSPDSCDSVYFSGNNNTNISGGGIFSNSTANLEDCASLSREGSGNVKVSGGSISAAGLFFENGSGSIDPAVSDFQDQQTLPQIPLPDCSALTAKGALHLTGSGNVTIDPGIYTEIKVGSNINLSMNPGMYCFVGSGGFTGTGGDVSGNGVFMYFADGGFDLGGNAKVQLGAPTNLIDPSGNQWAGMLIYLHPENTSQVVLSGSSGTKYRGTIYAPGPADPDTKPKCIVEGTAGEIGVASQLICYSVKLTGNATINLKYNAGQNYSFPANLGLQE